jgi:hypothetical protein
LEVLRNIRDDHQDLTKKIDEMKKALNNDFDKHGRNILEKHSSQASGNSARLKLRSLKSISEEDIADSSHLASPIGVSPAFKLVLTGTTPAHQTEYRMKPAPMHRE